LKVIAPQQTNCEGRTQNGRSIQALCHTCLGVLLGLMLTSCGGAGVAANGDASGPVVIPAVTLKATPATPITSGESVNLTWSSSNAMSCTASSSPAESDWSGPKAMSGSQAVTPPATGMQSYTLSCTGAGGSASASVSVMVNSSSGGGPTISSIAPQSIYLDQEGTANNVQIRGSGFLPGCVLHDSLFGDTTLPSGTDPSQIAVNLSFDTRHYSPGWITFSVSCPSGASNSANIAFVGNQNTLAQSASGEMYQLDQAQGAPAGQNGFVRIFNPNGTGNGSFPVGALANGIAFADTTGQVLVSYPRGPVIMFDPTTGMAVNTAGVTFAPSIGVATKNGLGCATEPVQGNLSCFVVSLNLFNPPFISVASGNQPWSLAMATLGTETEAVVYSRESTEIRRYSVVDLNDSPRITLKGAITLSGITAADQLPAGAGGWQLVTFNSGAASGTAAFLSQFDKILVFIDLNTMTERTRVTLQGIPFRIAADETHARAIVAFADVTAGLTRFSSVDVATGTVTKLTSTSALLTTGLAVSADGGSLDGAMRTQLVVLVDN
jgi:hypothetical protein